MVYPSDFVVTPPPLATTEAVQKAVPVVTDKELDELDDLYSDTDEESEKDPEKQIDKAMEEAEHLAADAKSRAQKVADAFDVAFDAIDMLVWGDNWIDDEEGRKKKAAELKKIGKNANDTATRALTYAVYSEYSTVAEHVIPFMISKYGKLVLRANEQGQEAAGQMTKKMIKTNCTFQHYKLMKPN